MSLRYGTFGGDFDELARLVATEWAAHYQGEPHFAYPADWLAAFLGGDGGGGDGADRELLVECRDDAGALAGFVAGIPRRAQLGGREVSLALCTLLTAARANAKSVPGFGLLRELFRRAAARGVDATYHFCVSTQRTHELLLRSAAIEKRAAVELAAVGSTMALARALPELPPNVRAIDGDGELAASVVALVGATAGALPLGRVESPATLLAGKRGFAVMRGGAAIAACTYARRRMVGKATTEVANVDLLVGPDATAAEATELGRAVAADAAAAGAQILVASDRPRTVFPHAKLAGFRAGARTLRAFVVPLAATFAIEAGSAHLLEIE